MIISRDNTQNFLPSTKPKLIILGTMVAICARTIDGKKPKEPIFYYHNNRNHFWKVLQLLIYPQILPQKMTVIEKKQFLNKNKIGIINLVKEVKIPKYQISDPSDTVLFGAYKKNKIKYKSVPKSIKDVLRSCPLAFTCREKKGIKNLIHGFIDHNKLPDSIYQNICFLPTPTRCNPKARSLQWKHELLEFYNKKIF